MKKQLLAYFLCCIFFHSCENISNQSTIVELIDLDEWNANTITILKNKMQWDTIQYIDDNIPPFISDGVMIRSFDDDMKRILSIREKEITAMKEQLFPSHEQETLYIYESQGFNNEGYCKYFLVLQNECDSSYRFTYNAAVDSFSVEKGLYSNEYYFQPVFYFDIEYNWLRNIEITTKITKEKQSQLFYEIIGVTITSD